MYLWQQPGWPRLTWRAETVMEPLAAARFLQGQILGQAAHLGFDVAQEANLGNLTSDVVSSAAIEGETLARESVRASLARRLNLAEAGVGRIDRHTDGVVSMLLDATQNFAAPLTAARLGGWQAALFPTGFSGMHPVRVGSWRLPQGDPMQIVSGPLGRERVHYEAPSARQVPGEMATFLAWFNRPAELDDVLRAGLAHLWFEIIHPFEDGNGRVGRAIADCALAQAEGTSLRFYSLSSQILAERSAYYDALAGASAGPLDVTAWLLWFVSCWARALAQVSHSFVQLRSRTAFWRRYADVPFNPRQRTMLTRLLDDFRGKLTAKKWAAICKCSLPTAQRDLADLLSRGVLRKEPGGSKKTAYTLSGGA